MTPPVHDRHGHSKLVTSEITHKKGITVLTALM